MPPHVTLQDIVDAMDLPNRDWQSYVNRQSGAIVTVTEDMVIGPDGEMDPSIIEESDEFLPLPTSVEIDEWAMMNEFAQQRRQPQRGDLLDSLNGRGAFRMFRSTVRRLRIEDEWDRFRADAFMSIAKEWLDEHGIEYE